MSPFARLLIAATMIGSTGIVDHNARAQAAQPSRERYQTKAADEVCTPSLAASRTYPVEATGVLILTGKINEGGADGAFKKIVDLRTGFSRLTDLNGPMTQITGFDGVSWLAANGAVVAIDLPGLVQDARAMAFVDRTGWQMRCASDKSDNAFAVKPRGGSLVNVQMDATTKRPDEFVIDADDGPLTISYSDWRRVQGRDYPFRQIITDGVGDVTILQIDKARIALTPPRGAFVRPHVRPKGRLLNQAPVETPCELNGNYIVVPVRVNGLDGRLVFDTGAVNYFAPAAAQRFGMKVAGGMNFGGVGEGSATDGYAVTEEIILGRAQLRNEVVIVAPPPWPPTAPNAPDGLTGFEFLSEFRTTIDYGKRALSFGAFGAPYPRGGRRLPFFSNGHSIYVEAWVNGHRGLYRVDTGSGDAVTFFNSYAERYGLGNTSSDAERRSGGVGGKYFAKSVRVDFTIAGVKIRDMSADISQSKVGGLASRTLAGNLGGKLLRCFRLTFDYHDRALVFEKVPNTDACLEHLH